MSIDVSPLFSPLQINSVTIPNRFVMPAMQRGWGVNGQVTDDTISYYCERVEGGVGLLISEGLLLDDPASSLGHAELELTPVTRDGWARCVDAVKGQGGNFFAQLWHPGPMRMDGQGHYPDVPPIGPSGLFAGKPRGRAATKEDISFVISAFVDAALLAQGIGFDGIEIHMAHGYLFHQFLWPVSNLRDDEYGGSMANRVRFPAEVVAAIRQATGPGFAICCRLSQWCETDYGAKVADSPEELDVLLSALRSAGADAFHLSTRYFHEAEWPGDPRTIAGWVSALTDAAVITVGSVGMNIDLMQSLWSDRNEEPTLRSSLIELLARFANDEFDLIAVGRGLIGDPQFVNKIRDGRVEDVRPFTRADLADILDEIDETDVPIEIMELAREEAKAESA
jgi:2,4-dienoyl-CoA reductase-like NADH-dependent reductase (Old Yellow Enzyme family)